jgi:hypothetical protein
LVVPAPDVPAPDVEVLPPELLAKLALGVLCRPDEVPSEGRSFEATVDADVTAQSESLPSSPPKPLVAPARWAMLLQGPEGQQGAWELPKPMADQAAREPGPLKE